MLDVFKQLVANQFNAALCTLNACIDRCPESAWNAKVGNHDFCQVVFHTLFYADFYLGPDDTSFRRQEFHLRKPDFFRDYEEFEDREPALLYDKPSLRSYVHHCREKAVKMIASETAESLAARAAFPRREFSRAELYVYNIRHIQHHAAQLSLRLRIDYGLNIPWIGIGWREM